MASASSVFFALAILASHAAVRLQHREMQVDLQASMDVLPQSVFHTYCGPSVRDGRLEASSAEMPLIALSSASTRLTVLSKSASVGRLKIASASSLSSMAADSVGGGEGQASVKPTRRPNDLHLY